MTREMSSKSSAKKSKPVPKTGLSFIVGEHVDLTHVHLMPELLARSRTPEVHQAPDRRGVRGSIDHSCQSLTDDRHGAIGVTNVWNRH